LDALGTRPADGGVFVAMPRLQTEVPASAGNDASAPPPVVPPLEPVELAEPPEPVPLLVLEPLVADPPELELAVPELADPPVLAEADALPSGFPDPDD
jgi:hypothetical protein